MQQRPPVQYDCTQVVRGYTDTRALDKCFLFDTCVTNETRPGNQTESNQINTRRKLPVSMKLLVLQSCFPVRPRRSGRLGLGTRRGLQRRTWCSAVNGGVEKLEFWPIFQATGLAIYRLGLVETPRATICGFPFRFCHLYFSMPAPCGESQNTAV